MSNFVERIDEILKSKNLMRKDLCEKIDISTQSLTDWSRKGSVPNAEIMVRIAKELGTTVEYLITGETVEGIKLSQEDIQLLNDYHSLANPFKISINTMLSQFKEFQSQK